VKKGRKGEYGNVKTQPKTGSGLFGGGGRGVHALGGDEDALSSNFGKKTADGGGGESRQSIRGTRAKNSVLSVAVQVGRTRGTGNINLF